MRLTRLRVAQLRCFGQAELDFAPGLNLITGANGSGKSSLIEAVHVLGYGRSFRGRVRDGLIRTGAPHVELYAEWLDGRGRARRAGIRHSGNAWDARLDGAPAPSLTELCAQLAVVTFEPGSHDLISGGSELRRRFLDWALFHVEPSFLMLWRRYTRALKQRNALLKSGPRAQTLDAWDQELIEAGEPLSRLRQGYLTRLEPVFVATAAQFLPELGQAQLEFLPGWRRDELALADALVLARDRDMVQGFTSVGPHRADWRIHYAALPGRETLSRGQEKLTALACILAQARAYAEDSEDWPVICLDDLASELDLPHQRQVLRAVLESKCQVLLTGTERPAALDELDPPQRTFHVEQGQVQAL